jgi:hypothetical protein
MALATRYRGLHHQLVLDVPQAAALIVGRTMANALAQQPYPSPVGRLLSPPCLGLIVVAYTGRDALRAAHGCTSYDQCVPQPARVLEDRD